MPRCRPRPHPEHDPVEGSDLLVPTVSLPSILGALVVFGSVVGPAYTLAMAREDGTLLTANRPFAQMLGYDSPAELQALSSVCGVFASPEDQSKVLRPCPGAEAAPHALFRGKDGCRRSHRVLAGRRSDDRAVTIAVFETRDPPNLPFPTPSA